MAADVVERARDAVVIGDHEHAVGADLDHEEAAALAHLVGVAGAHPAVAEQRVLLPAQHVRVGERRARQLRRLLERQAGALDVRRHQRQRRPLALESHAFSSVGGPFAGRTLPERLCDWQQDQAGAGAVSGGPPRSCRMLGTSSSAVVVTIWIENATQSVGLTPASSAAGPQIAKPMGWNASEPNQS